MTDELNQASQSKATSSRQRQQQWRDRIPEVRRVVEDVAPRMWESACEDQEKNVPDAWKALVQSMRDEVHLEARAADYHEEDMTPDERLGYHWNWKIGRVANMLRYLTQVIRDDLGFDDGATLASIVLLDKAMLHLQLELQDGGTKGGREDRLENRYRVQEALKALMPHFDDVQMRRLRALQHAEPAATLTDIPTEADVEEHVRRVQDGRSLDPEEAERHRDWFAVDHPVMSGVMVRSWLSEVDERFASLDPLVVLEEFAEARAENEGGRIEGGDGRTGPVRALARLSVMCGALDFEQKEGEDFDSAVERARGNLLVTRSRFRKAIRAFPGRFPEEEGE